MEADFIGKQALRRIRDAGVSRRQVGLIIDCDPFKGAEYQLLADKPGRGDGRQGPPPRSYSPRL